MKKYLFLLFTIISFNLFSQIQDPVDWSFSVEDLSNNTYNLIIEANIEKGWRIYSQHVDDDGPIPTSFQFIETQDFTLIGDVLEGNSMTKFDPVFEMDLSYFEDKAIFKQKITILNDTLSSIKGELEFMVCNATMCLPPDYVDMFFELKKKN